MEIFEILNSVPYLYEAIQGLLAAHALALFIVNLTDTPKDNELLAKAYKYIEFAAGLVKPSKAKQVGLVDAKPLGLINSDAVVRDGKTYIYKD